MTYQLKVTLTVVDTLRPDVPVRKDGVVLQHEIPLQEFVHCNNALSNLRHVGHVITHMGYMMEGYDAIPLGKEGL